MQAQSPEITVRHYRYSKARKLGKGATGSVYLEGMDTRTGQQVAIKVISMKEINNEVKRYLLMTEQCALQGLKHPNIIRCLDVIQEPSDFYFVTEYCPQGTLNEYIQRKGQVPQPQALAIFRGIVSGSIAMVGNGVTHRDLKPSNILMVEGCPKITDFGFCDIAGKPKPRMFYNVGSPSYMSPEAYMDNMYGEKSDVWAIGCILYEMLLGSTIDTGRKITDLYNYLKAGRQFLPNGISQLSRAILLECFRYDPRKRINMKGLEKMLESALGPMKPLEVYQSKVQPQPPTQTSPHPVHPLQPQHGHMLLQPNPPNQSPRQPNIPMSPLQAQELHRQHSVAPQINTSSLFPPNGFANPQQRGLMTSLGNPPPNDPLFSLALLAGSHSKSPVNASRAGKNSFPRKVLNISGMKGSIVDQDSWLARQIRQKDLLRETPSMIQNFPGVQMIHSVQQPPIPPQLPNQIQTPQQINNAQLRVSEMARPFGHYNRAPQPPMKMPPPVIPNRGIGATRFMQPPTFYR